MDKKRQPRLSVPFTGRNEPQTQTVMVDRGWWKVVPVNQRWTPWSRC